MLPTSSSDPLRKVLAATLLVALVLVVYAQVRSFDFVLFDDDEYVYANPMVTGGLTARDFAKAFAFEAGNWHPLTWLSHMVDVELFGVDPGAHHVVSAAIHLANAILLMLVLARLTGALGRATAVAAIFAVHPLAVENVAWIAERKTLLCVFFLLLAIYAYAEWAARGGGARLTAVVIFYALALMSKPYAITLPLLLVLLDFWPLSRLDGAERGFPQRLARRILEKWPLFALATASAGLTMLAQSREGAVTALATIPPVERVLNAVVSANAYLLKSFVPTELIFYYPHPQTLGETVSRSAAMTALAALLAITVAAFAYARRLPWLLTGWLWFLVSLLPVIGIVQVGLQARADRYAYLPLIGIAVAVVWSAGEIATMSPRGRIVAVTAAVAAVAALSFAARAQTAVWRDSERLFTHALEVDPHNWVAHENLGVLALSRGDVPGAFDHFQRARSLNPRDALALYNIGYIYSLQARPDLALPFYQEARRFRPGDGRILAALALTLADLGDVPNAVLVSREATAADPQSENTWYARAIVAHRATDPLDAQASLARLAEISPSMADEVTRMLGVP